MGEPSVGGLRPPVEDAQLDAVETAMGRLLPGEAGISWKDGSFLSFLPTMRPFGEPLDPLAAG